MGKAHPVELRERVVAYVEAGHSHRSAAERFQVSPRFVNDMIALKRETGSLAAKTQGHDSGGKLRRYEDWVRKRMSEDGEVTLNELCVELAERGVTVHRVSAWRLLHRLGLSYKKKPPCQ